MSSTHLSGQRKRAVVMLLSRSLSVTAVLVLLAVTAALAAVMLISQAQGRRLENFTRVEILGDHQENGTNDVNWLEVYVNPRSREVFAYQPQMVRANRTAVPVSPKIAGAPQHFVLARRQWLGFSAILLLWYASLP